MPIPNFSETIDQFREALKTPASATAKLADCTEKMKAFSQGEADPLPEETLFLLSELVNHMSSAPTDFGPSGADHLPFLILAIRNLIDKLKADETNKEALDQQLDCGNELVAPRYLPRFVSYLLLLEQKLAELFERRGTPNSQEIQSICALAQIAFHYLERMPSLEAIKFESTTEGHFYAYKLPLRSGLPGFSVEKHLTIFELLVQVSHKAIAYPVPHLTGELIKIVVAFYKKNPTFPILPSILDYPSTIDRSGLKQAFNQFGIDVVTQLYDDKLPSAGIITAFEERRFAYSIVMFAYLLPLTVVSHPYLDTLRRLISLISKHLKNPAARLHASNQLTLPVNDQKITGQKTSATLSWWLAHSLGFSLENKITDIPTQLIAISLNVSSTKDSANFMMPTLPDVCYAWIYALRMAADSEHVSDTDFEQLAAIIIPPLQSLELASLKESLCGNGTRLTTSQHQYRIPFSQCFQKPVPFDKYKRMDLYAPYFGRMEGTSSYSDQFYFDEQTQKIESTQAISVFASKSFFCNTLHRLIELIGYTVVRRHSPALVMQLITLSLTVIQPLARETHIERQKRPSEAQMPEPDTYRFGLLGCVVILMRAFCVLSNQSTSDPVYARRYSECRNAILRLLIDCTLCCESTWFSASAHRPPRVSSIAEALAVAPVIIDSRLPENDWHRYWNEIDWGYCALETDAPTISFLSKLFNGTHALFPNADITRELKQYIVANIPLILGAFAELKHCFLPGTFLSLLVDEHRSVISSFWIEPTLARRQIEAIKAEDLKGPGLLDPEKVNLFDTLRILAMTPPRKSEEQQRTSAESAGSHPVAAGPVVAAAAAAQVVAATAAAARPTSPGLFSESSVPQQGEDGAGVRVGVELTTFNRRLPGQPSNGKGNE